MWTVFFVYYTLCIGDNWQEVAKSFQNSVVLSLIYGLTLLRLRSDFKGKLIKQNCFKCLTMFIAAENLLMTLTPYIRTLSFGQQVTDAAMIK